MLKRITLWTLLALIQLIVTGCKSGAHNHGMDSVGSTVGDHVLNCVVTEGYHVYAETMTCPLGGEEFESLALGTHSTFGITLDWEPLSYLRFPLPIPVCPSNGFVVYKRDLSAERIARIAEIVSSESYQNIYAERHATFYLLAKLMEALGENHDNLWWYYRQATSEADLCSSPERYRRYAEDAIRTGEQTLASLDASEDEYWTLMIVIPNFYRRMGEFQKATEWLDEHVGNRQPVGENAETYLLGLNLLRDAIAEQSTERVQLRRPEDPD